MTTTAAPTKYRIESIDILRGLVMLIMAIDHSRDAFHLGGPNPTDLATTTWFLFFHPVDHPFLCAYIRVPERYFCLSCRYTPHGESIGIFLIKRGIWLIFVELALITLLITGNPLYNMLIFQVIWAIGGSMILLGLMVMLKVPVKVIGIIGAIIFFGHNIIDFEKSSFINDTFTGKLLLSGGGFSAYVPTGS